VEKKLDHWKWVSGPMEAEIGKNGFAPPGEKREGDGKTPSGIFLLKRSFGYDKTVKTKMPYRQASEEDLWVDDPNAADYNQWVKQGETGAASYEKMKREDGRYKYGIVIEYNTDPVIKGHGSAIFLHVWKRKDYPTAGCVAVSEEDMIKILEWLDPNAVPLIIMGIKD
jgi:L,D-peptidoglycan transpeptidase YkuD (ErfK/YbiS/YcfS/YnhG family)